MNTTFTNCAEKKAKQFLNLLQGYTKGIRMTAILILLLMGVSNAWADSGAIYGVYFTYDHNSANASSDGTVIIDLGTLTSDFKITSVYLKVWDDWGNNKKWEDGQLCYTLDDWETTKYHGQGKWTKSDKSGNNWELQNSNFNKTIASTSDASGKYTMKYYWQVWGNNTNSYLNNDGNNYTFKWTINPPAVNNFTVTATGHISGSGTNNDPYIIPSGQSLTLSLSGSKKHTDANSFLQYNTAETWNTTTTSRTISNITSTTAQSVTVKMRCHNSSANLSGTESSKTIYYKAVTYNVVGSMNDWNTSDNPMTITGDIAESEIYLNAGDYEFKIVKNDTWHTMKLIPRDIYRTSNTDVNFSTEGGENNNTWLHADATGNYTFKYNITNNTLTVIYPELQYYLVGDFGSGWDSNGVQFVDGKVTKTLTKRERPEYTFKVKASNGKHYTAVNKEMLQFTRQHTTEVISDNTDYNSEPYYNLSLQADMDGEYTFEFDPATFKLTVTHPEYSPKAAYLVGDFSDGQAGTDADDPGHDWTEEYGKQFTTNANQTEGTVEICDWTGKNSTWNFKVKINGIWYGLKETMNTSGRWILTDDYAHLSTKNCTIQTNGENGCYTFRYTTLNNGDIELQIVFPNDTRTVTFNQNGHGTAPAQQTILYGKTATKPIMDDADGYMFAGWYTNAACTAGKEYDFDTPVESDITLYAKWIPYTQCIFFKNTLGWKDVFVYTFSDNVWYDNEDGETKYGPGVCTKTQNNLHYGEMTQIGESDIFYFILPNTTGFNHIAFSDFPMNDWNEFYGHNAIYRSDRSDQMQLFIPQKEQSPSTTNSTKYYSSGLWMKYNSTVSGYDWSSNVNDWNTTTNTFTAEKAGGYSFTTEVKLTAGTTYEFKIHNLNGTWFGNGGTMTQNRCTNWQFWENNDSNAKITSTITGNYVFTIYLGDGEVRVSLDYPLSLGDYRLVYKDNTHGAHDGHYIKKRTDIAEQRDTVSFFIHNHKDESPQILLQYCSYISNDGKPTWTTSNTYNSLGDAVTTTAVYNFILKQTNSGNSHTSSIVTEETHKYTGDFYIRTDAAGGWKTFRQEGNRMTYSSFADTHSNFNHYYCKYIDAGRNVKFTIANDYSYCISDTLDNDDIIKEGQSSIGCLPINANVRFGWDSNTNEISRAYIKGAGMTSDRFLVLQGKDDNLRDANGNVIPKGTGTRTGLEANEEILVDQQNWIYQVEVTANNQTFIKLIAEYNGAVQYFKGNAENYDRLLSSTAATSYKIRLVYDFKSNNLVAAMVLDGNKEVEENDALGTDMMVIRRNQGHAEQLTFNPDSKQLTEVGTVYAVMTFTSDWINGTAGARERSLYWVSFPFDVKVSDVFGFGEYGEEWILQYYDGAERAEKGLFGDSGTYWKYIEDTKTTLNAGTGYVLALDLSKVKFLHGATEVSLYFPSTEPVKTISGGLPTAATVPDHWCNIDREWTEGETKYNHKYTDSHWNLIGVPGFADIDFDLSKTGYHFMQDDASFYYNFNLADSKYTVENSPNTEFQAMYAYMVQFAGTIDWTSSTVVGATPTEPKLAARRYSDEQPEKVVLCLELAQGEEETDRTFIQLQQEGATANFDLSLDLTKIMNSGFSNIYTLTDSLKIQVAGNALPMGEAIVPVGVQIAAEGEYTFRMPDGTEGMVVELVDYETNTRTNLLLSDYIVTLSKGTSENRFALHIQPQKDVVTSLENIGEGVNNGEAVNKYLIDGKLIIRTAEGIFDAQGHRL